MWCVVCFQSQTAKQTASAQAETLRQLRTEVLAARRDKEAADAVIEQLRADVASASDGRAALEGQVDVHRGLFEELRAENESLQVTTRRRR